MLLFPALLAEIGITAKDGIPVHLLSAFPALQSPGPHALSEGDGQNYSYGQGHIFGPCWKLEPIDEYEKEIDSKDIQGHHQGGESLSLTIFELSQG